MLLDVSSTLNALSSPTLADQAYAALRAAIVSGELKRGAKVTERGLADMLSVSATPVREALRRLEQDRLVTRTGPRSVHIADFDAASIVEVSLIESSLRALAARLAAQRATDMQLAEIGALLDRADEQRRRLQDGELDGEEAWVDLLALLRQFHRMIDESAGSPLVLHMLGQVEAFDAADRVRLMHAQRQLRRPGRIERYREHRLIYQALLARDADLAEELVLRHSRTASAELIDTEADTSLGTTPSEEGPEQLRP